MNTNNIESLVEKVQNFADPGAREIALELVQEIMDLHAAGLERIMQILSSAEAGEAAVDAMSDDPLVSGILLLHDLHPLDMEARVRRALGTKAQLLSTRDGIVLIRIDGGPELKAAVHQAVVEAAPDARSIVIEGGHESRGNFVPVTQLTASS